MTLQPTTSINQPGHQPENGIPVKAQPAAWHGDPFPPLNSGDRLTRAEFERRYNARPDIKKAELIEGVVYVASPVRTRQHGKPHGRIITWLGMYCAATPSVDFSDNSTLRLDIDNEPQPDVCAWIDEQVGGQVRISDDDYLEGAPELIIEVAASSAAYDLTNKLNAYRRNGVREYLVLLPYEHQTIWYRWHEGQYIPLVPDEQGVLRSQVLPGLWLQPALFWTGDMAALLALLRQGLDSAEHTAFVEHLQSQINTG